MSSYIMEQLLSSNLYIYPKDLNKDIDNIIQIKLKEQNEGLCNEHGYIIKDSIYILKRSLGNISTKNNKSAIKYVITYKARTISPSEGDNYEVFVNNINKMGIIAFIKLGKKDVETINDSPLMIIIPKEYIEDSIYNINDIMNGQKMNIIVIGVRTKYKSDKIQIVARPS